jgi:hypothetical protein
LRIGPVGYRSLTTVALISVPPERTVSLAFSKPKLTPLAVPPEATDRAVLPLI